jgi:hypothetical protein
VGAVVDVVVAPGTGGGLVAPGPGGEVVVGLGAVVVVGSGAEVLEVVVEVETAVGGVLGSLTG